MSDSQAGRGVGVILRGVGGFYEVLGEDGHTYTLRPQGKLRRQRVTPMVGDRVAFEPGQGEQHGWLEAILPRRNRMDRPPVANVDLLVLVVAAGTPQPDLMLVDRLLLCARLNAVPAALMVNKADEDPGFAHDIAAQYAGAGIALFVASARCGDGLEALRAGLAGRTAALCGQSGVGKTTALNALYGLDRPTGELSARVERGKHTTRHAELIPVAGGARVLDTPGFSLMELPLMPPEELAPLMPEFAPYQGQCRFSPCAHASEPDCAVRAAADFGAINGRRWARYVELLNEMRERWKNRYD
ncbi:MAG: ribosome small subunit-dependent GTPase A [Clostridiales bacterium]|nr:ribosome small subunit-dependent GTPase A [Clostridiales bacterium]